MRPEVEDCTLNNDEQNLEATNLCKTTMTKCCFPRTLYLGGSKAVQISISSEQGGRSNLGTLEWENQRTEKDQILQVGNL
jgi:hypothetical protein